uniref:Uncharacterized protein n=1 Tax=Rhizophora mucronata TaxID=61149 RepID=A0A2P2R0T9_RHIMU
MLILLGKTIVLCMRLVFMIVKVSVLLPRNKRIYTRAVPLFIYFFYFYGSAKSTGKLLSKFH